MRRIGSTDRRKSTSGRSRNIAAATGAVVQRLEDRQLLSITATAITPVLAHPSDPAQDTIDLASDLTDTTLPAASTIATFTFYVQKTALFGKTHEAQVQVALTDESTPITVGNFLEYVNSGLYNGTFFHRATDISTGGDNIESTPDAATIEQGGGYYVSQDNPTKPTISRIQTFPAITNESGSELYGNIAGTIAMALDGDPNNSGDTLPNSGNSEFYFNVTDNTSLDTDTTADGTDETGYTVFGTVIGDGLSTLQLLSTLPTGSIDSAIGLTDAPIAGLSATQLAAPNPQISASNLVYIKSVTSQSSITYTASSNDPSLVTPIVRGNTLSFAYGGSGGTAIITVNAVEYDGSAASESFAVTVPGAASTATGPVVAASTAAASSNGSSTTLLPLAGASDSASALNPATVTITTAPADGTATVDTTTGDILYTPTTGFSGTDTIKYTVADEAGTVSIPATITIDVTTPPATVTLGTKGRDTLVLTQPNGTVSHLSISGGTATITFAGSDVDQSTTSGSALVSGTDATIASIDITNAKHHRASLSASGGAITLSSIYDAGIMNAIAGSNVTLTGTLNVQGLANLSVAATDNALLQIGSGAGSTALLVTTATDTSVQAGGLISTLRSNKWISDNGGAYAIAALGIRTLQISGEFDNALDLAGVAGDTITTARIGGALGSSSGAAGAATWTVGGAIGQLSAPSVNSDWALQASGSVGSIRLGGNIASAIGADNILNLVISGADTAPIAAGGTITKAQIGGAASGAISSGDAIQTLNVNGNLTGSVTVGTTLGSLNVTGDISGSTIASNGAFSAKTIDVNRIHATGAITNETISSVGNMGTITATSLTGSAVFAGILSTDLSPPIVPTADTDFVEAARIAEVHLNNGTATAFSNSKIAAATLGEMSLGLIDTNNGGVAQGLSGETLTAVDATLSSGGTLRLRRSQLSTQTALLAYLTAKDITMGDFVINVVEPAAAS